MEFLREISFANMWVLLLIPAVFALACAWYFLRQKNNHVTLTFSSTNGFKGFENPLKGKLKQWLWVLRVLALTFLLVAMARPQTKFDEKTISSEGIDIVLAMDVSTSMLAKDFSPNRMEAAKKEAQTFVDARRQDRIGLVIFAGESFTQCPVTIDHAIVKNQLKQVKNGVLEDGTAIGMGLATAVQRLKDSESKSKVVILMTDGVNNKGLIDPATASDIAMQFGVRVYTIGVGSNGMAMTPVGMYPNGELAFDYAQVQIDEDMMKSIAKKTGGQYFRATGNTKLKEIYAEIDKLEKTKINVSAFEHKTEMFLPFALIALLLLTLEIFARYTIIRSIP